METLGLDYNRSAFRTKTFIFKYLSASFKIKPQKEHGEAMCRQRFVAKHENRCHLLNVPHTYLVPDSADLEY
jgi:hypothetical protein